MRKQLIELDLLECVIGLGKNLFYNSSMEACIVICRSQKPIERKGKVLLIQAVNEVSRERSQSFLRPEHQARILNAYQTFSDEPGFSRVSSLDEIKKNGFNLSIQRYVKTSKPGFDLRENIDFSGVWTDFETESRSFWTDMDHLVTMLDSLLERRD